MKVAMVEDHVLLQELLASLLDDVDNVELIGKFNNGKDFLESLNETRPDLVLMDIMLPELDGITCTRLLKERLPDTKVLVLTVLTDHEKMVRAIEAGASGYVTKTSGIMRVLEAIRAILSGESYIDPCITNELKRNSNAIFKEANKIKVKKNDRQARFITDPLVIKKIMSLTSREKEIMRLIGMGEKNGHIAEKLYISENTVKVHISNIRRKLKIKARMDLVLHARSAFDETENLPGFQTV